MAKKIVAIKSKMDFPILVATVILVLFGLLMMSSASYYRAAVEIGDALYYAKAQAFGVVLGIGVMIVLSHFKYTWLEKLQYPILIVSFVLLAAVFLPGIGVSAHDSSRWVNLGFIRIQPAEIMKFALIIFMSSFMSKNRKVMDSFFHGLVPIFVVVGAACLLIILQPNFSMLVSISLMTFVLLIAGGARKLHLGGLIVVGLAGGVALILSKDYRIARVFGFLDPWADPLETGYQLIQSFYAIASGGMFGRGIGNSTQKLLYLPFGESDFVFSIMAEEIGFIGIVVVLALYFLIIFRGIRIAVSCPDRFGSLIATGITSLLAIQVIINVAVVTGSIPPTGQPLPFISFGSSSLVIFMAAMGVLLNISRYTAKT